LKGGHVSTNTKDLEPWKTVSSQVTYTDEWLTLRTDTVLLPNGQLLPRYHTIDAPDWVNIVAINTEGDIVLIAEYRHGAKRTLLELPGGHIDAGESPEIAAQRELMEETGYGGGTWHDLGTLFPAAARFTNELRTFLAIGVRSIAMPKPSVGEIIRLECLPWTEFARRMRSEVQILDATYLASLFLVHLFAQASTDPFVARLRL
jgi:8-oxo-dGTP pyrophosphatase MutT (NUDIX family)